MPDRQSGGTRFDGRSECQDREDDDDLLKQHPSVIINGGVDAK
jgi:hypothetical protein